jgi:hypothetical protein
MPGAGRWTAFLVLALTIAGISAEAWGADGSLVLPELTVTAPPVMPAWKKWNPYGGSTRVEEDKWPDIPCSDSRVGVAAAGTCKTGTPQESAPGLLPNGPNSNCRIAHDLVMTNLGNLAIEADVMVFDPYYVSGIGHQHQRCAVLTGYGDLREDFADMNQMTRKGSGWRNFLDNGDLTTMQFSIGLSECLAIEKRGPRWGIALCSGPSPTAAPSRRGSGPIAAVAETQSPGEAPAPMASDHSVEGRRLRFRSVSTGPPSIAATSASASSSSCSSCR